MGEGYGKGRMADREAHRADREAHRADREPTAHARASSQ